MTRLAVALFAASTLFVGLAWGADGPATPPAAAPVQPASPATQASVDAALEKDIRRLLELTGAAKVGMQVIDGMIESFRKSDTRAPASFWDDFRKEVDPNALVEMTVPIYARYFTREDIKGLIAFYESPLGRKLTERVPQLTRDCMEAGQKWGAELSRRVTQKLRERRAQTTQPSE